MKVIHNQIMITYTYLNKKNIGHRLLKVTIKFRTKNNDHKLEVISFLTLSIVINYLMYFSDF